MEKIRLSKLVFLFYLMATPQIFADSAVDFGTASKTKLTLNPAGAALIDRILVNFTSFSYKGENRYSPYVDQVRENSNQAYLKTAVPHSGHYDYNDISSIQYEKGKINGTHLDLAYPAKWFTVGFSYDGRFENYGEGSYNTDTGLIQSGVKTGMRRNTNSFLLAVPLSPVSFGIRQNQRKIEHRIENLDNIYISSSTGFSLGSEVFSNGIIEGRSFYRYYDYGLLWIIHGDQPMINLGLLYRPSTKAVFEFESLELDGASSNYSMANFTFTEPGVNLINTSLATRSGRTLWNVVLEAGSYTETDNSLQAVIRPGTSERDRFFDIMGYLFRFGFHPYFDIAYGVRSHEIAGSLTEITTTNLKIPIPFVKDLIVAVGSKQIRVMDEDDIEVVKSTSYSVSAEMKFGKPAIRRGRTLAPKTKTLPPDFP